MKKITSVLLCMVLLLSVFCVNAAAAETTCMEAGVMVSGNGTVTVTVTAKQSAANARLTVDFGSDKLTYVGYETDFAAHSVKADEEKLTIGLANASANAVKAGDEVIEITFASKGDANGAQIVVTAERFDGKTVGESIALVVDEGAVIAEGWSGYTTWVLTANGTLTFRPTEQKLEDGQTNMKNYWKVGGVLVLPWSAYADQITKVVIEEGIHDIGQMAFYELPNLTEVVLPESAVEIRHYAFKNCKKLTTINLEVVEFIREGAFYGCTALEEVNLAEGVEIEDFAFGKVPGYKPGQ